MPSKATAPVPGQTSRPYTGPLPKGIIEFPLPKTGINERISAKTGKVTSYNVRTASFVVNGKTTRETIGGDTIEDLQANWTSWHVRNRDTSKAEGRAELKTLGDFGEWFLPSILAHKVTTGEISEATYLNRCISFRLHIQSEDYGCADLLLGATSKATRKLNLENLEAWVRRMQEKGVGPAAIKHAIQTLHLLGKGMKENPSRSGLRLDPTLGLDVPKDTRPQTVLATEEPYKVDPARTLLLTRTSETVLDAHLKAFWRTVTSLGLRRNELCGLEWDHFEGFDWSKPITNNGWLNVQQQVKYTGAKGEAKKGALVRCKHQKGDRTDMKRISVPAKAAEALRQQKIAQNELRLKMGPRWGKLSGKMAGRPSQQQRKPGNWVFTRDGLNMLPHHMNELFNKVRREAGVTGISLHDGRHDMISIKIAEGVALDQVQRDARHKRISTTLGYAHEVKRADEAADAINSFWDRLEASDQAKAV